VSYKNLLVSFASRKFGDLFYFIFCANKEDYYILQIAPYYYYSYCLAKIHEIVNKGVDINAKNENGKMVW